MTNKDKGVEIQALVKKHFPETGGEDSRTKIVAIISEMFESEDEHGIYRTGKAYDLLEYLVESGGSHEQA